MERGQLLGGEAGVAEGVLLPGDPVAVDLREARRAPARRAAGCPSSRSSSLSRSKARRNAVGPPGSRAAAGSARAGSGRRASSSSAVRLRRRSSFCPDTRRPYRPRGSSAARAPAARGGAEEQRVLVGPAAHRRDVEAERGEERGDVGPVDDADVVARRARRRPPRATATSTAERVRSSAVRVWWLTPRCRGRGSPSDMRSTAIGRPPSAAAASRIAGHLERGGAERRRRCRPRPGPSRR